MGKLVGYEGREKFGVMRLGLLEGMGDGKDNRDRSDRRRVS